MDVSYSQMHIPSDDKGYDLCTWCFDGCAKGKLFCEDCEISSVPELILKIQELTQENNSLKKQLHEISRK